MIVICAICILLVQISTAHLFTDVPRQAQNLNNFNHLASNRAAISRSYANYNDNNLQNTNIANTQLANAANAQLLNAELANSKFANSQILNAELANANYAKAEMGRFQPSWANKNIANALNMNVGIANNENQIENARLWAENNLANINGNMATFNFGDGPNAFTLTSGSPNSPAFGIQLLADALEVGGTLSVNGQYPIFGTVAVNGNLPTDGSASVNYNCGRPVNV